MLYQRFGPYWGLPSYSLTPYTQEHNNGFPYARNSQGHRCEQHIDYTNYILFQGCSLTEGTGVAVEDSWPYRVAELLSVDYYNLALPASGNDVMSYNVQVFLANNPPPKAIVVMWADPARFAIKDNNTLVPCGPWIDNQLINPNIKQDILTQYRANTQEISGNIATQLPILEVDKDSFSMLDLGTDNQHPGPMSHNALAEQVAGQLKKLLNM